MAYMMLSGFNSIMLDVKVSGEFAIFSRCLLLSARLLLGNLIPDELYFAVFHLFLVNFYMLLQMIASGESFCTTKALVRLDSCKITTQVNGNFLLNWKTIWGYSRIYKIFSPKRKSTHLNEIFDVELLNRKKMRLIFKLSRLRSNLSS